MRGRPAQPAQFSVVVRRVAQAVESLQSPAAQHDGPLVAEGLEAPVAVVTAEPAGPWEESAGQNMHGVVEQQNVHLPVLVRLQSIF